MELVANLGHNLLKILMGALRDVSDSVWMNCYALTEQKAMSLSSYFNTSVAWT